MMEYLIDNTSVEFGGQIFQQTIDIPYARACSDYQDYQTGKTVHYKTVDSGIRTKLLSTFKKIYERHYDLVNPYNVAVS